ncbi:hypothetical protein GCM10020260_26070 [Nesterenkonia halobia]|uniref:DUF1468 domain-containing protein n=1 Tax=Nesterenkonia halobia TaxID=37922 RepID=A0ABP6RF84_9MICC
MIGVAAVIGGLGYGVLVDGVIGPGFLPIVAGGFVAIASVAEIARLYRAARTNPVPAVSVAEATPTYTAVDVGDAATGPGNEAEINGAGQSEDPQGMGTGASAGTDDQHGDQSEESETDRDTFGRTSRQRRSAIMKIFALMLAVLCTVMVIGLLPALTAMLLTLMLWVERKPLLPSLLVSLAGLGVAYLLFVQLLGVPTPVGIFGF